MNRSELESVKVFVALLDLTIIPYVWGSPKEKNKKNCNVFAISRKCAAKFVILTQLRHHLVKNKPYKFSSFVLIRLRYLLSQSQPYFSANTTNFDRSLRINVSSFWILLSPNPNLSIPPQPSQPSPNLWSSRTLDFWHQFCLSRQIFLSEL